MNYIDLFAGAGGLSEGFMKAGFTPLAHVEMNSDACQTIRTRLSYHYLKEKRREYLYFQYLRKEISRDELYAHIPEDILKTVINQEISEKTINRIFNTIDGLCGGKKVDVIIGGPPCQAYSMAGRAKQKKLQEEQKTDKRNYLYKFYCRFLKKYQPEMFVFENVPGLLTANQGKYFRNLQAYLKRVGYQIDWRTLNASDYGVLQNRKRIIIVGWKIGSNYTFPELKPIKHNYLVNDLLSDLPAIQAGEENNEYAGEASKYLKRFSLRTKNDVLTYHIARPHIERDKEIYRKTIQAWQNGHQRLKYSSLPAELKTHKNVSSFLDRFKIVEGDMPACHTMMAHISKDGHYFIHPDIEQVRSITVREAARIQSFPDNYYFEGGRTAAFTQIGNAVPPLMAKAIALKLKEQLEK